ncbi:iron ABC transporter substrate-binding protein [Rubrobacter marinus]|uniref:iron ABC transporter substrate-binding protein n=1 Tax=Rubrobacter marinus TaxID=2653852 RepID=UPI001A9E7C05|nr:iron ABC transporter substrate-binding protein [Rubrobacter marinus]
MLLKRSSIFVLMALSLALAGACGQEAPSGGQGSGGGETAGGETTGGTTGETTAAEPFRAEEGALVIYSGREEGLVGPLIEQFEEETGIDAQVRYGDTAELAATISEEGENSPADVFFAQDPGALGAIADAGALKELPQETLDRVPEAYRSPEGQWVGTSGRARVVAYNTEALQEDELPPSIFDFTDPEWSGRIGWAPTNASFQAFVTALRVSEGEDRAREWLEGIQANDPIVYPDNSTTLDAVASGEVEVGFINHYYLYRALAEQGEDFGARNYILQNGDPGALVLVAGAGILNTADNPEEAQRFVDYLLADQAQQFFADETFEYPMVEGIQTPRGSFRSAR